jgi:cardiolipin synthase
MARFDFYDKRQYYAELNRRFKTAGTGTRILVMSMTFEPTEPEVAELLANLIAAAERGADVTLGIDARSFLSDHGRPGPLWYHRHLSKHLQPPYKLKQLLLTQLNIRPNSRAVILNQPKRPFSITVAKRSHIKIAIINDYLILGGCNLDQPANTDLMIGWQDATIADQLYLVMRHITDTGNVLEALSDNGHAKDKSFPVNDTTDVLIDAGVPNQSLIFSRSLELIDSAQDWLTITCQFFPNSVTAEHLFRAKQRGVKVDIIYADPRHHGPISSLGQRYSVLRERRRLPADMFQHVIGTDKPFLHAKVIACDAGLMIGSHNYVRAGVRLGTAEIALQTSDAGLTKQALAEITRQL